MTTINTVPAPDWNAPGPQRAKGEALTTITLSLKCITPLFGGGYEPGEVDTDSPIRPAAVRGHLRFWWRATAGAQYATAEDLFKAEAALWGSAELPGAVALKVRVTDRGKEVELNTLASDKPSPKKGPELGYFLFPFQNEEAAKAQGQAKPAKKGGENVSFELELRVTPKQDKEKTVKEIENAIKAWIAFGGVGARTRRGCGALTVTKELTRWLPPPNFDEFKKWVTALYSSPATNEPNHSVLAGGYIALGEGAKSAIDIWKQLATFWARFRKGHVADKEYTPMAGARWGDYRETLAKSRLDPAGLAKPFLGLPIIYQEIPRQQLPFTGTLEAEETGRMASPVILKPVATSDNKMLPLVIVLDAPRPRKIRIQGTKWPIQSPKNDPVLKALGVRDPLEAVVKAAERHLNAKSFRLGGTA
jgi:CRISPR-associated protein Cmr1